MIYIGIDPGLTGAVAIISDLGDVLVHDTPSIVDKGKRFYAPSAMATLIAGYSSATTLCCLERVHAMPGQGVVSMFRFGEGYGIWEGIIATCGYALIQPTPQQWMKTMGVTPQKPSRVVAAERFPLVATQIAKMKDHNRADALCLAWYAKITGA